MHAHDVVTAAQRAPWICHGCQHHHQCQQTDTSQDQAIQVLSQSVTFIQAHNRIMNGMYVPYHGGTVFTGHRASYMLSDESRLLRCLCAW